MFRLFDRFLALVERLTGLVWVGSGSSDDRYVPIGWWEVVKMSEVAGVEVDSGGKTDYDYAVLLMDDELRELLHAELSPCSAQVFFDAYAKAHLVKFGSAFEV